MKEKLKAMVMASFLGDSLAMPAHWIYDTMEIDQRFGRVDGLRAPPEGSYHHTKKSGEFTHYGDQTMVLLESLAAESGFSLDKFAEAWKSLFAGYRGYFDHATKTTLQNFAAGKPPAESGSASTDLAGASRIAPLIYAYHGNPTQLIANCRSQTAMTHNSPAVVDSSEWFAKIVLQILAGKGPLAAFSESHQEHPGNTAPFTHWIAEAIENIDKEPRLVIGKFGRSCATEGAFRSVVYLAAKYQANLQEGLIENVMAGGDSAARGLLLGMILGAHNGMPALPQQWLAGLKGTAHIENLLATIDGAETAG